MESASKGTDRNPSPAFGEVAFDLVSRLRDRNPGSGEFLAIVSHEIRTPLNGMLGFARLLLDAPLHEEDRENVRTILASTEAMARILDDLLDFARMEVGQFQVEAKPFQIGPLMEDVRRLLGFQAQEKGIVLRTEITPDVSENLIGDAGRIRQVLLNLAGNAIKFTSKGHVVIRVEMATPPSETSSSPSLLQMVVKDSGVGIPSENLARVFQPFYRGAQRDVESGGTGLGLFIVGKLVAAMAGTISIESTERTGTVVAVTLPCQPEN